MKIKFIEVPTPEGLLVSWCETKDLASNSLGRWLDGEDKATIARFLSEKARMLHLAGRALIHRILQEKLLIPKGSYLLTKRSNGSPGIKGLNMADLSPIYLSVTHSTECVVAGVSLTSPLGLDVEARSRKINWYAIAKEFFHKKDFYQLCQLNECDRVDGFLQMWTRKESLGKLRGVGIVPMLGCRTPLFDMGAPHVTLESNGNQIQEVTLCLIGKYILSLINKESTNGQQSFKYHSHTLK